MPQLQPAVLLVRALRRAPVHLPVPARACLRDLQRQTPQREARVQEMRHREDTSARKLQNQMQTRAAQTGDAAEEAAARGAQAEDPAVHHAAEYRAAGEAGRYEGRDRDGRLTL